MTYTCLQIYHLEPSPGGGYLSQYSSNCKMQCKVHPLSLVCTSHTRTLLTKSNICVHLYIYFLILFLTSHLFNQQTDINECLPMYVHGLVAFFFWISQKNGPPIPRNKRINWCGLSVNKIIVVVVNNFIIIIEFILCKLHVLSHCWQFHTSLLSVSVF